MVLVTAVEHPKSMDFLNQRRVYLLRKVDGLPWLRIRRAVRNLQGQPPSERQCREVFKSFSVRKGRRLYRYSRCGRKPWKVSKEVERFLLRSLRRLRQVTICTSRTLQAVLARQLHVQLECSTIRKVLARNGYRWLPRAQKPKYSRQHRLIRLAFVEEILRMTEAELAKHFAMSMGGVVLGTPPADPIARENHCRFGDTHMYRKRSEAASPELGGKDLYGKQLPESRAVPLWGGVGPGGFGLVLFHRRKKVTSEEWADAVTKGRLTQACRECRPDRVRGPWRILCDNEAFLRAPASRCAHLRARVELQGIPARSPDLSPVEQFWSWLRRRLRAMDLADLIAQRQPVQKRALRARVRRLVLSLAAKDVAKHIFSRFRRTCLEVQRKRGAAARG